MEELQLSQIQVPGPPPSIVIDGKYYDASNGITRYVAVNIERAILETQTAIGSIGKPITNSARHQRSSLRAGLQELQTFYVGSSASV